MATLGNDCYFFCTSTCAKGAACPFRHVEAAKTCRIICQHWQMGTCLRPMCKFRHSDFIFQVDTGEVPCYWESQPAGCIKKNCPYKHSKPALQDEKTVIGAVSLKGDPTAGTSSNSEDIKSQNIVQPVVTSATQPSFDSEKTSSSQKSPTLQESEIQVNTDKQKTESDDSKDNKADSIQNISSIEPQKPKVTTKKIKVSPVSKMKQKSATAVKKKRKENDADSIAGRFTIKAKKNLHQPRKSIKERLGRAPVSRPVVSRSPEESDSESGSESDDSIENIKVMSVEEILRQKALESMMKKRAGEGRTKQRGASFAVIKEQTLLPSADKKILYPALDRETRTVQKNLHSLERRSKTSVTTTKKVKHVPAAVNRSSSSSSEESDSSDENEVIKQLSESSSDTSDSLSASSSSDTDENSTDGSEELDIRRVVVDLESEKAARKKAKESFMKKQNQNAINTQDNIRKGRVIQRLTRQAKASAMEMTEKRERVKKRFVNVDYDSDDFICSRVQEPLKLHVRDRLGKSTSLHKASSDARLLSTTEKFGSEVVSTKVDSKNVIPVRILRGSNSSSSEDEQTPLTEVKVKTLEEIRLDKMKIMAQKSEQKLSTREGDTDVQTLVSVKNRLGAPPGKMQKREVVHSEARQVVLLNGTKCDDTTGIKPSDEQKKTKKRPWRTVRPKTNPSAIDVIASDERTSIVSSPSSDRDDYSVELDHHKNVRVTDESSFEILRRRALMRKLQAEESKRFKKSPSVEEVKTVDDHSEKPEFSQVVDTSTSVKTHKHKHGHKHKKVKTERKIYLPPAMKSAASKSSLISENLSQKQVLTMAVASNVSPLKREPHPIAAAWAAGLALSSKGMSVRRLEPISTPAGNVEISSRIKVPEQFGDTDRSKEIVPSNKMPEPAPESSVTIKSFAEIMAEKRKRRLEMQAQKAGTADLSAASVATSSLEPSMIYSSSASSVLPANACPLKSAISHQSIDVKPTSPLVSDQPSVTTKMVMQAGKATKQSLVTTTKEVIPEITDVLVSRVSSSTPVVPSSTLSSQGLVKSIGQKVKLKSTKKNHTDEREKHPEVFTKRNDIQQSCQSCIVTSENRSGNFLSSSSCRDASTLSQTVRSPTDNTTLLHVGSNKTSHQTHKPVSASAIETSSSQLFQNIATIGLNMADNGSVSTLPKHVNSPDINEQTYSSKQSVAVLKEESQHARKNARQSLEDEFSFFEDEDMVVEDTSILENIEPIDSLLQDIDDLLS